MPSALVGLLIAATLATPALSQNNYDRKNAKGKQLIVRSTAADAPHLATEYGLALVGEMQNSEGYAALLEAPDTLSLGEAESLLKHDARVQDTSRAVLASLPTTSGITPANQDVQTDLSKPGNFTTPCLQQGFSQLVWSGYANQDAIQLIRAHQAHLQSGDCGTAVVAIIDSGVDPLHPLLQSGLVNGYDFLLEQAGIPSEWAGLDLSTAAIVEERFRSIALESEDAVYEGQGIAHLHLSTAAIVEARLQATLEQENISSHFGHGTMVAGLVRAVAPTAWVMPLRVFNSGGTAHVFDIARAIYHAVDNGADIINMSFSIEENSKELQRAIQYARGRGVICVAAAGNQGEHKQNYPASYTDVISVAAVDDGLLASFSNYGSSLVDVAAPGSGVVSAYPGGLYGAAWGTSFSAPLVSGTVALLLSQYPEKTISSVQAIENNLRHGSDMLGGLNGLIGSGQLNALNTVLESQK